MLPDLEKYEKAIDANTCMVSAAYARGPLKGPD